MAPKPPVKSSKSIGKNSKKPKSLTEGLNEQVNAAEKKVQEIEKKSPSNVTNDLGEAAKQVEEKATPTGTPEEQALAKEAKQSTESPKEEVIDPEEWFRNTRKEPKKTSNEEKESIGNPEGEEPKNKNTPPKGEQGTFDFDFGDKAKDKANSKAATEEPKATTGIDPNKALNPNDFEAGTGAKDSSMDLYTRFASIDPKNLTDPYGKPIDWNSVDGKSDIAISLGDRVLTIPKELAMDMANSVKNNQYDRASLTVARSLGLEAKPDTNAAYVEKGADLSKQGEKYLKKLMEDPNTPGLTRRLLTHLYNNKGKYITGGLLEALAKSLTNDAENDVKDAEAADQELEDDTPIDDIDSALNGVPKEEDTTPGQLAVNLEKSVNDPDTDVGAASINGHASDGENGESDNPEDIEQASTNLNEAVNGIPSHLPQDVPDEEEGKEAAAKEYNPTYTPKQEMYNSLASSTAEPREAEPTFTENTVDQLKAADNVSNGGSVNTPAPTAKVKTRAKSSKAAPVNNAPMAGSRPDVSAPGYGAADLSAALGQAAQGAPVDGYDRMFDPSLLEYMRRVSPNTAYGIEQEMRRRGMM